MFKALYFGFAETEWELTENSHHTRELEHMNALQLCCSLISIWNHHSKVA